MAFTLTQLQHFVAAAETGRVSKAAARSNIAQPSLSSSLGNLEEALGSALFLRHATGLQLTAEGERFLRHARHILASVSEATEDVRTVRDLAAGEVTIGVHETVNTFLVPSLLRQLPQNLPKLAVRVVELEREAAEEQLLSGQIDLAIMIVSHLSERRRLAYDMLIRSPRQLWTSVDHPLLEKDVVSLADIAPYEFALLDMDEHVSLMQAYWSECGFVPRTVFQSKSMECIRSLVGQGHGVTILSDFSYRTWSLDGGRVRKRPILDRVPSMDIGAVYRADPEPSPAAFRVIELARRLTLMEPGRWSAAS